MKILSINLCTFMPGHPRKERIAKVRQFIEAEGVDVCLFQEGLSICPPIYSTPKMLTPEGFSCVHKPTVGAWWFYTFRVGLISRFPIIRSYSLNCEVPQTQWLDSLPLPGRSRAVAVWVDVPGMGIVAIVSVHLTASPKTGIWREAQVVALMDWIKNFEADAVVLGGDFNFGYSSPCYPFIKFRGFTQLGESAPDFVFANKGSGGSRVVLNDGTVTDHAGGLLVEIA